MATGFWGTLSMLAGLTSLGFFIYLLYSLILEGVIEFQYVAIFVVSLLLSWLFSYLDDGVNPLTGRGNGDKR